MVLGDYGATTIIWSKRSCYRFSTGDGLNAIPAHAFCHSGKRSNQLSGTGTFLVSNVIAALMDRTATVDILGSNDRHLGSDHIWLLHDGETGFIVSLEP